MQPLGYRDLRGAMRHIKALHHGLSCAQISSVTTPALLWLPCPRCGTRTPVCLDFASSPNHSGSTSWYLRMLRDSICMLNAPSQLLSSLRLMTDLLEDASASLLPGWIRQQTLPLGEKLASEVSSLAGSR